ncbi:hypothetical protein [Pedobacter ginsengisoli]|nr:hypothetical protein [Pedobacter ginsengisoli]
MELLDEVFNRNDISFKSTAGICGRSRNFAKKRGEFYARPFL